MSNARNISKADSRFVNATGDTISGIVNNESKVGIKVGSSPDTNLEVATRYSYNYTENMAIKVRNSESNYNNHMYLGSIGSSMIIDGARYYGGGAYLFEDSEASMIQMNNGATNFHARTGATAGGSSYSFPKVMGIDNSGRVTMPYQPSFRAHTFTPISSAGTIIYTTTAHNIGNHYNTSNGVFTAPVSGVYHFDFNVLMYAGSNVDYIRVTFKINNSISTTLGDNLTGGSAGAFSNYTYHAVGLSQSFYLAANDTVRVYNHNGAFGTHNSGGYGSFSGHLLG